MKKKIDRRKRAPRKIAGTKKRKKVVLPGYPLYRDEDDIFAKAKEENIDLGENTKIKKSQKNKNKFDSNLLGDEKTDSDQPEELEHMVTDDDDSDDSNLNIDEQYDLGGED